MWKPSATSPYMLPRPSPLTRVLVSMVTSPALFREGGSGRRSLGHRDDLAVLEACEDVVVRLQGVVLARCEGGLVSLDQAGIGRDLVEAVANLRPLGGARCLDRQGDQVRGVVGVGDADGGRDVSHGLDR